MADNSRARQNTNKENALMLAKVGVVVFPSSGKTPLIPMFNRRDTEIAPEDREAAIAKYREDHDDKTPIHVGATTDPEVVKRMWRAFRDAVPSIACGPNGLVVFDADAKDEGPAKMAALWGEHGGLPEGALASPTKSDGKHFIFADPERSFTNKAGLLKRKYGTDVRGSGGQIVAPGSLLDDGRSYGTRDDLFAFLRAYTGRKLPEPPPFLRELIGAAPDQAEGESVTPSKEREVIQALIDTDWPEFEDAFDPALGKYDLDALKQSTPEFAALYDEPSPDCSTNRFLAARHVMREWPSMPVEDLAVFFEHWEGSGTFTSEKPRTGEYDLRQVAREWIKNQGLSKPSTGDAFGAVVDEDEDDAYSKQIADQREQLAGLKAGGLRFMRDIAVYTTPDYIVEYLCTPGQIGMIHGASNVGKTFSVIHLGESVCMSAKWFSRNVAQNCGALYCFGEGAEGLGNRAAAYRRKYPSDKPGMVVRDGIPNLSVNLAKAIKSLEKAIAEANDMLAPFGQHTKLVFLDTWAKAIAGAAENDPAAVQPILNSLRALARKMGVCIILIHHSGKDTMLGARGSSSLFADVDFNLEIIDDKEAKKRKISGVAPGQLAIISPKMREGNKSGLELFRLEEVILGTNQWGNPDTSMVVVPIIKAPSEGAAMGAVTDDEEPGTTKDELTADQNRQAEQARAEMCQKVLAVLRQIAKPFDKGMQATVAEVVERLPALARLKAEGGTKNFARNLRDALLGGEPRVLLPEGWIEYVPATGKKSSLLRWAPRD